MIKIGLRREIHEDDIYAVTKSMRSDQNTEAFAKLWQLELEKKDPSLIRAMLKFNGVRAFALIITYSIGSLIVR